MYSYESHNFVCFLIQGVFKMLILKGFSGMLFIFMDDDAAF